MVIPNRKVHGGGKRLRHAFRALYDFYGKRVDYGEGEFPSCWPTDVAQDDENGWQLRVAPEREPFEERGDWTRYNASEAAGGDAGDGVSFGEDLYYNTITGESTYQAPADWDWSQSQALDTSFYDAESSELANSSMANWSNDISLVTDDSAYYCGAEQFEVGQEEISVTAGAGEQDGYGVAVEGTGVQYASSGDWTKYYDTEYAVDYYHNSRTSETQYDRPEGFQTPRDEGGQYHALDEGEGWQ